MTETTRKLASIREINEIRPILEADAIECAMVGGWPVVVKKGEYKVGDLAIYLEIDSWVPHELAPFLSKGKEPREYNGVKGERLRTLKLRGQISQGLLIKPSSIPLNVYASVNDETGEPYYFDDLAWEVGDDVTAELGIQKWEAPIPACLAGQVRGNFPSFIPKTDQERCLSGETKIDTCEGEMTIQKLCERGGNVSVKSYNILTGDVEMKQVIDFSILEETDQDWFCLITNGGKRLVATGDHKVWCDDIKAYRKVRDIRPGQLLVTT